MGRCDKLIEKAKRNPAGLRFYEAQKLAECLGFTLDRQRGSHHNYVKRGQPRPVSLQPKKSGMAKAYQVRQLMEDVE